MVCLTFDDGPNDKNTPRILEILKKENIKATFFLTGQNVARYPDVVKQIYQSGNAMGLILIPMIIKNYTSLRRRTSMK